MKRHSTRTFQYSLLLMVRLLCILCVILKLNLAISIFKYFLFLSTLCYNLFVLFMYIFVYIFVLLITVLNRPGLIKIYSTGWSACNISARLPRCNGLRANCLWSWDLCCIVYIRTKEAFCWCVIYDRTTAGTPMDYIVEICRAYDIGGKIAHWLVINFILL